MIARIAPVGHDCCPRVCRPALIDEMRVEVPVLRQAEFLVPPDVTVGTGFDELLPALGLFRIDQHDSVLALADRTIRRRLDTRRVVAMVAHGRHIGDVDHRHAGRVPFAGY